MERLGTHLPPLGGSPQNSRQSESGASATCSPEVAAKMVDLLFGQYRKADVHDPETYAKSFTLIFCAYPEEVVRKVIDPVDGIATRNDFVPTTKELKDACERHMEPLRREAVRRQRREESQRLLANPEGAQPWRDTGEHLALPPSAADPWLRKSFAELQAECQRRGGMVPRDRPGSTVPKPLSPEAAAKLLADLAERAKQPCGVSASPELLAKLAEERS